jgi:hypothetical protein
MPDTLCARLGHREAMSDIFSVPEVEQAEVLASSRSTKGEIVE